MTDSDDDLQLSDYAKQALAAFYEEQKEALQSNVITEDWQVSSRYNHDELIEKLYFSYHSFGIRMKHQRN